MFKAGGYKVWVRLSSQVPSMFFGGTDLAADYYVVSPPSIVTGKHIVTGKPSPSHDRSPIFWVCVVVFLFATRRRRMGRWLIP